MKTLINTSQIRDYSSEPSTVIYSNPVTTVVRKPRPPAPPHCCCEPTACDCCEDCCDDARTIEYECCCDFKANCE